MKYRMAVVIVCLLATLGCGSNTVTAPAPQAPSVRNYTGTASVGDFFTITLDPNAQTLTYTDLSNNVSGTAAYTENANTLMLSAIPAATWWRPMRCPIMPCSSRRP